MAKNTDTKLTPKDEIPKAKFSKQNFKKSLRLFKYLDKTKSLFILSFRCPKFVMIYYMHNRFT